MPYEHHEKASGRKAEEAERYGRGACTEVERVLRLEFGSGRLQEKRDDGWGPPVSNRREEESVLGRRGERIETVSVDGRCCDTG
jgi:hypothetical protein